MTTQIELQQYLGRLYGASGIIVRDPGSSTRFWEWNGEDTRDLCVTAGEVLHLPGAIETYTHVNLNRKARKLYDQMAMSFHAELESGEKITAANALAGLMRFQQLTSGFAHTEDGKVLEVDDSKARALADILEDLPNREPVVVFARFQNDLDAIARVADGASGPTSRSPAGPRTSTGGTPGEGCWRYRYRRAAWAST